MILTSHWILTMLRNKPRRGATTVTTTKQASSSPMADQSKSNMCHCSSSLFTSPKFRFFTSKITPFADSDFSLISPTSILEANSYIFSSSFKNPKPQRFHPPEENKTLFGLADLVKNREEEGKNSKKPVNKMVLFGSKLRVQIPSTDFGTKTGHTGLRYLSPKVLTGGGSGSISDQTEDYTRVISHGPNPTITHIFDNSVFVEEKMTPPSPPLPLANMEMKNNFKKMENFLSYCYTCKKNLLDHKQDIYIYRGEKGFCSSECRYQEMLLDQMEI